MITADTGIIAVVIMSEIKSDEHAASVILAMRRKKGTIAERAAINAQRSAGASPRPSSFSICGEDTSVDSEALVNDSLVDLDRFNDLVNREKNGGSLLHVTTLPAAVSTLSDIGGGSSKYDTNEMKFYHDVIAGRVGAGLQREFGNIYIGIYIYIYI